MTEEKRILFSFKINVENEKNGVHFGNNIFQVEVHKKKALLVITMAGH